MSNKTKIEKLEEVQEQEDNQIIEFSDQDLDDIVGGNELINQEAKKSTVASVLEQSKTTMLEQCNQRMQNVLNLLQ